MRTAAALQRDSLMYLSRRLGRGLAPPDRVSVNVTLRCNLACTMCTTCYDAPELSTAEIKGIIDQTADWGVPVFNPLGGEPFMRGDIEELLAYAVRRGFYVTVTTNGTLITEKRAAAIAAVPADRLHFNLSLDGDEGAHDAIRGKGMFKRALQGLHRLRAADAAAGNSRRKILANTILHAQNLDRFEAILDEQAAMGFDGVQILNLFRAGPEVPPAAAALWFQEPHQARLAALTDRLVARARAQGPAGYQIQNPPSELSLVPRYYAEDLGPLEAPCWAGWKELYINADGAAIMCDGQLDFLAGTFGNVREETLQQLWQSPRLQARRAVVKRCTTPCVQHCYLRTSSDSGRALVADAGRLAATAALDRLRRWSPRSDHRPDEVLRIELSDVCPCDDEGCPTPPARWAALTRGLPERPRRENWARLRDHRHLDFGRGFMGFEVVRRVIEDLQRARRRVGRLSLSWRGDPLLHPEIEPILRYLLARIEAGEVADRLHIESPGDLLSEGVAALSASPAPQAWVIDLDRGDGSALGLLQRHRGPATRLIPAARARPGLSAAMLRRRIPDLPVVAGPFAEAGGDFLWLRRADHGHFLANAAARADLARLAGELGVVAITGEETAPRRCQGPARLPTISWDGKLTLCPADTQLGNRVGEVTAGSFTELWEQPAVLADRRRCASAGVPDRALCRDCPMPWSPNHRL